MKRLVVFLLTFLFLPAAFVAPAEAAAPPRVAPRAAYGCNERIMTLWQGQIRVSGLNTSTVTLKVCYSVYGGITRVHAVRVFSPGDKIRGMESLKLWANNPTAWQYASWGPRMVDKGDWVPIGLIACNGACNQLRATFSVGINAWPDPSLSVGARVP